MPTTQLKKWNISNSFEALWVFFPYCLSFSLASEILCWWFLVFLCRVTIYVGVANEYIIFHLLNFVSMKLFCIMFFYSVLLLTLYLLDSCLSELICFRCCVVYYTNIPSLICLFFYWLLGLFLVFHSWKHCQYAYSYVFCLCFITSPFIVFLLDNLEAVHAVSLLLMVIKDTLTCILN